MEVALEAEDGAMETYPERGRVGAQSNRQILVRFFFEATSHDQLTITLREGLESFPQGFDGLRAADPSD